MVIAYCRWQKGSKKAGNKKVGSKKDDGGYWLSSDVGWKKHRHQIYSSFDSCQVKLIEGRVYLNP